MLYRPAVIQVAAKVQALGGNPSEYYVEVRLLEFLHELQFQLWHESGVGSHYTPNQRRHDFNEKGMTVGYDAISGQITKVSGWR